VPPPWGTQAQSYKIITHVEAAIRAVPRDLDRGPDAPEVLITTYLLDRKKSIDELIAACRRGASVRVIIDKGIETQGSIRLARALNGDNTADEKGNPKAPETGPCGTELAPTSPTARTTTESSVTGTDEEQMRKLQDSTEKADDGTPQLTEEEAVSSIRAAAPKASWGGDQSYLTQCQGSCRGGPGRMHTKFYAFSKTGTANNVVMVSSSNLNKGGAVKGWNDLYSMKQVPAQFAMYEQVHDEMGADRPVAESYQTVREGPFTSRFFPMKNGTKATDPTLADLKKVQCKGSTFGNTKVNIAMFYWASARGEYLLDKILAMARAGCRVNIILGAPSKVVAKRLREASRARLVKVWDSRHFTKNREIKVRTHNKYVAIKGTYAGNRSAHLVMTGSQNWGHGSLDKSDDSTLNIELGSAYTQYLRQWEQVKRHSIRMAPPR
jgi:hypothetical protein